MAVSLRNQLRYYGCDLGPDDFRDLLLDVHFEMYPNWNDERLVRNPKEALSYCQAVRTKVSAPLPDEFILGTRANIRKSPAA